MIRSLSKIPPLLLLLADSPALFARLYRYDWYNRPLLDWLDTLHIGQNARVLELGCGPGRFARDIADRGIDVTAMDRSARMIGRATDGKSAVSFLVGDALQTGLEAGSFDFVLSASLVNVVADSSGLLTEMGRVLKPQGIASVLFPTPEFDGAHAERLIADYGCGFIAAGALRLWASKAQKLDPSEIVRSFEKSGFQQANVTQYLDGGLAAVTGQKAAA